VGGLDVRRGHHLEHFVRIFQRRDLLVDRFELDEGNKRLRSKRLTVRGDNVARYPLSWRLYEFGELKTILEQCGFSNCLAFETEELPSGDQVPGCWLWHRSYRAGIAFIGLLALPSCPHGRAPRSRTGRYRAGR
jgi:hypothetical protein